MGRRIRALGGKRLPRHCYCTRYLETWNSQNSSIKNRNAYYCLVVEMGIVLVPTKVFFDYKFQIKQVIARALNHKDMMDTNTVTVALGHKVDKFHVSVASNRNTEMWIAWRTLSQRAILLLKHAFLWKTNNHHNEHT